MVVISSPMEKMQEMMHTAEVCFRKQSLVKHNHKSDLLHLKKVEQGGKIYSWDDSDLN